jgi:hypothetical protein
LDFEESRAVLSSAHLRQLLEEKARSGSGGSFRAGIAVQ